MREDAAERATSYIETMTRALDHLSVRTGLRKLSRTEVDKIISAAAGYTNDAEHYAGNGQPVTSLACVAYAEGLLDALKLLGLIEVLAGG